MLDDIYFMRKLDRVDEIDMNIFSSVFSSSQHSYILWSFCEEGHTRTGGSAMGRFTSFAQLTLVNIDLACFLTKCVVHVSVHEI